MSRRRRLVPDGLPRPTVILWDLDNVDPGLNACTSVSRALDALAGPDAYKLASGHPRLLITRQALLLQLGWVLLPARARRDAADAQLLHAAGWLRRHAGMNRFVVASCDHAFAPLAARTEVTVAALRPTIVSRRLAAQAAAVVPLEPASSLFRVIEPDRMMHLRSH